MSGRAVRRPVASPGVMAAAPETIVVGLGSNLGDARSHLEFAVAELAVLGRRLNLHLRAVSPLYRSAPWQTEGPDFLNAVAVLEGAGDQRAPQRLLQGLLHIEQMRGRERPFRYAPRTLDLDLILFGQRIIQSPDLVVPHPRALQRAFVLQPLHDVLPGCQWPALGPGWSQHLSQLPPPQPQRLDDPAWPPAQFHLGFA